MAVPDQSLMLKWPNDLLLNNSKLAGILLERSGDRVVAGFGVNLATAPRLADRDTAALNGVLSPQSFAPLLAGSFSRMVALWRSSDPESFARAWLARAHPVGTRLPSMPRPRRRSPVPSTESSLTAHCAFAARVVSNSSAPATSSCEPPRGQLGRGNASRDRCRQYERRFCARRRARDQDALADRDRSTPYRGRICRLAAPAS